MGSWIVNVRASKQRGMGWREAQEQRKRERVMLTVNTVAPLVFYLLSRRLTRLLTRQSRLQKNSGTSLSPPLYMLRNRFWDWIRANPLYSCHGDQGTNADKVCVCVCVCARVRFFSPNRLDETDCMHACHIPRRKTAKLPVCVCVRARACVCVCVCHERSDSDWECLSSRAPAGVLDLPMPSLRRWGTIELGCQLREGWAAAGAATNNLSLSLDGYKRLRWLSLQKQEHVQSDRGINHGASDVEQRHLRSGDTGAVSEYKTHAVQKLLMPRLEEQNTAFFYLPAWEHYIPLHGPY